MYFVAFSGRIKPRFLVVFFLVFVSVSAAVLVWVFGLVNSADSLPFSCDLRDTKGVAGFLSQFSLEYDSLQSSRELELPQKDDEVFVEYNQLQSRIGLNVLDFSGKRVQECYIKLKNKTKSAQNLYAVVYIYKEKVIACHLCTLIEGSDNIPINALA